MTEDGAYTLSVSGPARRTLGEQLPETVVAAVLEFITGDLLRTPRRVGKPLREPFLGTWGARRGTYRVIYTIDDEHQVVTIIALKHRRDAYRPH